jgi:hypothetical protein
MPLDPDGIERSTNGRRRGRTPHSSERTESARIVSGQTLTATAAGIIAVQALETECLAEVPCVTASDRHGLVGACVGGEK